jgi:2-hydroxychromene-2-carboxylate isomerase
MNGMNGPRVCGHNFDVIRPDSYFATLTFRELIHRFEAAFDLVPQRIQIEGCRKSMIHAAALAPVIE